MTIEPRLFIVIIAIVLVVIGAGIAGFFILRKKKKSAAAPPPQGDGQPISPAPAVSPPAAEPVLKCVGGVLNGKSYPISDVLCIGTNAAFCSVLYPEGEPGICGIHCKLSPSNGQAQLVDADSGGTFINGVPILPNVPYSMPVGSSFTIGSPKNIFIIAENTPSAQQPAPLAVTGNPPPAKKRFPWIAVISAVVIIAAAVILFLLLGKKTYTGVTGKAFVLPDAGFANLVFDGEKQTNTARVRTEMGGYDGGYPAETLLSVSLGTDRFVAWYLNEIPTPLETDASFDLTELTNLDHYNWIGAICDETNVYYSFAEYAGFDRVGSFDEADLTVLERDGDQFTFYFYLKMRNYAGESHTVEGVACVAPDQDAPEPYTGVTGKAFGIPDAGSVNLALDGKEQTVEAAYCVKGEGEGPSMDYRILDISMHEGIEGIFTEWGYVQWSLEAPADSWKPGASFDLSYVANRYNRSYLSMKCYGISYDYDDLEEAVLTVLELDGDEMTFYFRIKFSYIGASHTLEGVGRAPLMPVT